MEHIRRNLSYANVVASIALFVALGGGAYAVVGNPFVGHGGTVSVCLERGSNELQAVAPGTRCANGSLAIALNEKGRRGATGRRGVRGPRGWRGQAGANGNAGATGPQGGKGEAGSQGAQGPKGDTGQTGPAGPSTGPAGGDLSGSYPNPTIAAGAVSTADLASGAVTNTKLANSALTITAGTGLTGGGSTNLGGSATLSVDPATVQTRVSGSCPSGSAIDQINQDGTVDCASVNGVNSEVITAAGTAVFTVPNNVTELAISLYGGGGGGQGFNSATNTAGRGGGSGSYVHGAIPVAAGGRCNLVIGTGGVGGTGSPSPGDGAPGGSTTINCGGVIFTAGGGGQGGSGGTGGTATLPSAGIEAFSSNGGGANNCLGGLGGQVGTFAGGGNGGGCANQDGANGGGGAVVIAWITT